MIITDHYKGEMGVKKRQIERYVTVERSLVLPNQIVRFFDTQNL